MVLALIRSILAFSCDVTSAARFQLSSLIMSLLLEPREWLSCRESTRRGRSSLDSLGVLRCLLLSVSGSNEDDDTDLTPRFVDIAEAVSDDKDVGACC